MKISEILLVLTILLFIGVGFVPSGGHPAFPAGIITWPIAGILLLTVILRRLTAGSFTKIILLIVVCYLSVGILIVILLKIINPLGGPNTFLNLLAESLIWPFLLPLIFSI